MHPVLSKFKFKSFDGLFDVHGTERQVAFVPADDGEDAVLAIRGLSIEDALHVLDHINGGLLKGDDAINPASKPKSNGAGVKTDTASPKAERHKRQKIEVVQPEPEPESDDDLDEGKDVDVDAMTKMEKLRPVIEHMVSRGYKSAADIVTLSSSLKDQIPALKEVEKKGDFEKRMERAAMVVLGA